MAMLVRRSSGSHTTWETGVIIGIILACFAIFLVLGVRRRYLVLPAAEGASALHELPDGRRVAAPYMWEAVVSHSQGHVSNRWRHWQVRARPPFFVLEAAAHEDGTQPLAVDMDGLSALQRPTLDFVSRGGAHFATDLRIIMPIRMPADRKAVSDYDVQRAELALGLALIDATGNG